MLNGLGYIAILSQLIYTVAVPASMLSLTYSYRY